MDLIDHWQQNGENYKEGVQLLALYNPSYALLPDLRVGESDMNRIYLAAALRKVSAAPVDLSVRRAAVQEPAEKEDTLLRQIKELQVQRRTTRLRYYDTLTLPNDKGDQERVKIDIELREVRKRLHSLYRQHEVFKLTGEMPPEPSDSDVSFDCSEVEKADLIPMRNRLRSRRSKAKGNIKKADTPDKLAKYQQKLIEIENELSYVEQEITRRAKEV